MWPASPSFSLREGKQTLSMFRGPLDSRGRTAALHSQRGGNGRRPQTATQATWGCPCLPPSACPALPWPGRESPPPPAPRLTVWACPGWGWLPRPGDRQSASSSSPVPIGVRSPGQPAEGTVPRPAQPRLSRPRTCSGGSFPAQRRPPRPARGGGALNPLTAAPASPRRATLAALVAGGGGLEGRPSRGGRLNSVPARFHSEWENYFP